MGQNENKKLILRIKEAYDKFTRKLNVLRSKEREVLKEYKESDRQQKIFDIQKELEK